MFYHFKLFLMNSDKIQLTLTTKSIEKYFMEKGLTYSISFEELMGYLTVSQSHY